MVNLHVSIHGIPVTFLTSSELIASPIQKFLEYFSRQPAHDTDALTITFHEVSRREEIPFIPTASFQKLFSRKGRALGDQLRTEWECSILRDEHRLIADFHGQGLLVIDELHECAEGYIIRPEALHPDLRVGFFHFVLAELLKRRGLFTLHATSLEKNGRGILIPGYSGRGKTTAFLSLLRSGYRCLSDDHPLLRETDCGLEILPLPVKVDVTEPTIAMFPELREAPEGLLRQGVRKRFFYVEDLYPGGTGESCEPSIMIFPHVVDSEKSWLEPLSKRQALEDLLPHGLLVYNEHVARQEFQMLSKLVQRVDCYRLHSGRDVLELPKLIEPLLEEEVFVGC